MEVSDKPTVKRLDAFDVLKGIGIILVLYGHTICPYHVQGWIYSFHMPLFFFISGFFYKKETSFMLLLKKKVKQLVIPWIFFALCLCLVYILVDIVATREVGTAVNKQYQSVLRGMNGYEWSVCYLTIWFLVCLFEVSLVYDLMQRFIRNKYLIHVCILCFAILGVILFYAKTDLPYFIDTLLTVLIFYHAGYLFRTTGWYQYKFNLYTIVLFLLAGCMIVYLNGFAIISYKTNELPWFYMVVAIPTILGLYLLCNQYVPNGSIRRGLAVLGNESLILMGLHKPLYRLYSIVVYRIPVPELCKGVLMLILALVTIHYSVKYLHRYLPYLVGKLK